MTDTNITDVKESIKRKPGRPKKYHTEEEKLAAYKQVRKQYRKKHIEKYKQQQKEYYKKLKAAYLAVKENDKSKKEEEIKA